jgi:asparagine synthase (glutamine-hydrolysing)
MCGFVGYINKNLDQIDPLMIKKMMQLQQHRGPDDSGLALFSSNNKFSFTYSQNDLENLNTKDDISKYNGGIGFNRLSVIDITKNGHQPMANADKTIYVTFNGEIYNAFQLKNELIDSSYNFKSKTDTEIILVLYEKYGLEFTLKKLNGMFAICILDLRTNKIFLARDRFGIKPLYYIFNENFFSFSSEIKSFLAINNFKFKLNKDHLSEYFIFKYLAPPNTLISEVNLLLPGEFIVFENNQIKKKIYYDFQNFNKKIDTKDNKLKVLEEKLKLSVKSQLMSDVSLGCQLSGGVDSSLITLFAKKFTKKIETFSILFKEKNLSEEIYIKKVINDLDLINYSSEFNYKNFYNDLCNSIWSFDAPLSQINSVGIFNLAKLAKSRVKVLLSGEGADEIHGGYPRVTRLNIFNLLNKLLQKNLLPSAFISKRLKIFEFNKIFSLDLNDIIILLSSTHSFKDISNLIPKINLLNGLDSRREMIKKINLPNKQKSLIYEMKTFMHDLFIKQDKMTMASSIENRVPFLDNDLVDYSLSNLAYSNFDYSYFSNISKKTKKYLKKISTKYFGKSFTYRPKSGFSFPLKKILRNNDFRNSIEEEVIPQIKKNNLYDLNKIIKIWNNIDKSSSSELELLFTIIVFEIWLKKFRVSIN